MSDILKSIYNACDPYEPATAQYYVDCSAARGNASALTQEFQRNLELADDYLCFLFSGHFGCGKSSELAELTRALNNPVPPHKRYFPILINVSDYLDDYDVASTDIQLAIMSELAAALRDHPARMELKDNYFIKRFEEVKDYFLSDTERNEGEINLGLVKFKLQRLKQDPVARHKVRAKLEPHQNTMKEEMNTVFDEARTKVRLLRAAPGEQPYTDIVVILDNLERIRRAENAAEGEASLRALFIDRYAQFTGLQTHIIYTMLLRLVRSADGPQLLQRYGPLFVLPMVKVHERGTQSRYEKGIVFLRELLQKRVGGHNLEDVIAPDALDFLLTYSGGHIRNLMIFLQNACSYAQTLPISLQAAHRAIAQSVSGYSTSIAERFWPKLVQLERSDNQQISVGDPEYLVMLETLSVLEYINDGDETNPFTPLEPWYAVNPIVRELQKFKSAMKSAEEKSAENTPAA